MNKIEISDLKARTDIVDVIGRRISLRRKGSEQVGVCPFHDDKRASLQVNAAKQVFACFACGKSGDVIDFLVEMGASF
ncbi:MAG: CHC2 zinc finger domain-containing protein, partial [Saprospiraceae bacterium]